MHIRISKSKRKLWVFQNNVIVLKTTVALGQNPIGTKTREGDGCTPEGIYRICLEKAEGKYGQSLGLDYPSQKDAEQALREQRIDEATYRAILSAHAQGCRPPWGTPLGGEIYLHGGGTETDWTQGCIALGNDPMAELFALRKHIERVEILPD